MVAVLVPNTVVTNSVLKPVPMSLQLKEDLFVSKLRRAFTIFKLISKTFAPHHVRFSLLLNLCDLPDCDSRQV